MLHFEQLGSNKFYVWIVLITATMSSVHVPRPPGGDGGIAGRPDYGGRRQHSPITSSRGDRTTRSTASKPSSAADQVEYMQTQCDLFTRRIEVEKRRAAELDKKLKVRRTATPLPFSLSPRELAASSACSVKVTVLIAPSVTLVYPVMPAHCFLADFQSEAC